MKIFTRIIGVLLIAFASFTAQQVQAQSVLNPSDSTYTYNSSAPPTQPVWGQPGKWVRTVRLTSWNTNSFKPYIYKSNAFRLKFPKTYNPTAVDGKKYPMLVFFHGMGEGSSSIYDNEYQLYHGGQLFRDAVDNGTFDGYILCMQTGGGWGAQQYEFIRDIINYMVTNNKLDAFRVITNGLSGGAQGTWEMFLTYPTYVASALPMSGVYSAYTSSTIVDKCKFTPIWNFHGGLDGSPSPYTAYQVRDAMLAAGGNYKNTTYPTLGHGTWYTVWAEPDFWPFTKRAYASNPWTLFGRTEFCPGDPINVTVGLVAGFDEYQWRKDGVVIPGATTNTINVTTTGVYDARVRRGTLWSDWSVTPVEIKTKTPTITPDITVSGLMSKVIPAPDGNTGVTLQLPTGYASYLWQKVGSSNTIGTANTLNATSPGDYIAKVTEQYGCSASFSNPFRVIDANGPNKPDAAINLVVTPLSKTSLKLDWSDNPTPLYNETNFEVYQSLQAGGPYSLIVITPADVLTTTINNLSAKTKYFYKVRAVNATAAAPVSNEASGTTDADVTPPTAPTNLVVTTASRTSVSLSWTPSTDDVGVARYEVYVNGQKAYISQGTKFTVNTLETGKSFNFAVKAIDASENASPFSNQVTGQTVLNGLYYKYYEGNWSVLPDFNTLTPVKTGITPNVDITVRNRNDQFGFLWEGYIIITTAGSYTFRTRSDDGSRLWLGGLNQTGSPYSFSGTPLINNDGGHAAQNVDATITLAVGVYPIAIAFFEGGGGEEMGVLWKKPGQSGNPVAIPNSAFNDSPVNNGSAPVAPSNLVATAVSYRQVNLNWTDNSNNETGFEIWRSTSMNSGYVTVGNAPANATSFVDSTLNPSTTYYFHVKALGQYGESAYDTPKAGVTYKYYENNGTPWTLLPDFTALTPKTTGRVGTFTLTGTQERADNFGLVFDGYINCTTAGNHTFYTTSNEGSKLYIDGTDAANLIVSNDGIHNSQERSGTISLTTGLHRIFVTYFERTTSETLSVSYTPPGGSKVLIPALVLSDPTASATTSALPGVPAAPTGLLASGISKSSIQINWADNANNETGFELFRSSNTNGNYIQLGTLPANTTSYVDTGLFANSIQYYKVRAAGVGGKSNFTNEDSAKTFNGIPVITDISNRSARYGVSTVIPVSATDTDGDPLSFTAENLPGFGSLTDNGNNTASLTLNPSGTDLGTYNGIRIIVHDTHGGADTTSFNLVINDNFDPVITDIPDYTLDEKGTVSINLSATDQNAADQLTWSVTNLPDAYTLTPGANGAATLVLNPGFAAAGTYAVNVNVTDGNGGSAVKTFTLTVNDVTPQSTSIYTRFKHQTTVGAPWNNITNVTTNNLVDENGNTTSVGLALQTSWWATWNEGPNGNGSGVYPDPVLKEYYFFGAYPGIFTGPETVTGKITGLDVNKRYDVSFYAGSIWSVLSQNGTTTYTIGAQTININVQNNTQNLAVFGNLAPAADGTITFTAGKAAGTQVGYIGAIVIKQIFDDGTAPAKPKSLIVQNGNGGIQLNWQDVAYNETGYEVYRALSEAGSYSKVGETSSNTGAFLDNNISGNTHYYYKVRAINGYGQSDYSNVADATTQNRIPTIDAIANVALKNNQQTAINVVTHDDATDIGTLTVTGLPSFASFTDNGNGTGVININPNGVIGTFTGVTVTVTDGANATSNTTFDIAVTDKDVSSVYVNFTDGVISGPKPWNNFTAQPFANASLTNLKDDADQNTGMSVTLMTAFEWYTAAGMRPGNGKGIYPESVMRTALYESSTNTRTIRVSGLSASKKYNFVFFNSLDNGFKGLTNFTINSTTLSLNATYNLDKTIQFNGISPDANGQVNISVQKAAGQDYAYVSAMIIQSYDPSTSLLSPTDLRVKTITSNSIGLQWQDRSSDETGFEIWRATSSNGSYSLLTTVAANTTSYTNGSLNTNATYYYIVRAVKLGAQSAYTGAVSATTYSLNIYVNYANTNVAPLPWFNTQTNPQQDYVWSNIYDATGMPTNANMVITQNFAGLYSAGMQTGTGIYPDKVMFDSYGLFPGETGKLKFTGLNMSQTYDFTFFGSTTVWGDVNTAYTINGKSVLLNTSVNSTGTLTLYGIHPDEDGEVEIVVTPGTPTSQFGLLGACEVHGYNAPASSAMPTVPGGSQGLIVSAARSVTAIETDQTEEVKEIGVLGAYPNPFKQGFVLSVPAVANDKVDVQIFDVTGRTVYQKLFSGLHQGANTLKVESGNNMTKAGVYMVRVTYVNSSVSKVIKIEKQ
jgi:predicted esterase